MKIILATAAMLLAAVPANAAECDFENETEYFSYLTEAKYFETWWPDQKSGKTVRHRLRFSGTVDNPIVESKLTKPGGSLKKAKWWVQPKPKIVEARIFQYNNGDDPTGVAISTLRTSKKCRTYYYPYSANNFERVK